MRSPYTGKEMQKVVERRVWKFRGEAFEYEHVSWRCPDTGEEFTTPESDDAAFNQVTSQYRVKYGIPSVDEIIGTRKKYHLSAAKMALLLGFGINQYRLYEQGEVPSLSNARLITAAGNPSVMAALLDASRHLLTDRDYQTLHRKIHSVAC